MQTQQTGRASTPVITAAIEQRFWSKVARSQKSDRCWTWTASVSGGSGGYGNFYIGREHFYAHRIAFLLTHGYLPAPGEILRHRCDNPRCCNPRHIHAGTHQANSDDKHVRGRARTKMKAAEVVALVNRFVAGEAIKDLSASFRVSEKAIRNILGGQTWSRVTGLSPNQRKGAAGHGRWLSLDRATGVDGMKANHSKGAATHGRSIPRVSHQHQKEATV